MARDLNKFTWHYDDPVRYFDPDTGKEITEEEFKQRVRKDEGIEAMLRRVKRRTQQAGSKP